MVKKLEDITYIEFQYLKKRHSKKFIDFEDIQDTVKSVANFLETKMPSDKKIQKSLDKYQFLGNPDLKLVENKEQQELDYQVFRDLLFDLFNLENDTSKQIKYNFSHLQRQAEKQEEFMKQMDNFITHAKISGENESMASSKRSYNTQNTQKKEKNSLSQIERQNTYNSIKSIESYLQEREVTYDQDGFRTVVTTIEPKIKEKRSTLTNLNDQHQKPIQNTYMTQSQNDKGKNSQSLQSGNRMKNSAVYNKNQTQNQSLKNLEGIQSARQHQEDAQNVHIFMPYSRNLGKNNTQMVQNSQEFSKFQMDSKMGKKRRESHNLKRYDDPYQQKIMNNILGNQNIRAQRYNKMEKEQEKLGDSDIKKFQKKFNQNVIDSLLKEQQMERSNQKIKSQFSIKQTQV
ncbi:hypothetical protein PPERSA_11772 [Pseudocohnilembus persalinus]|uniref:Uncharacterized protein n=1 Tax=Pseudocohnilembus persalinus TaxID=266149 RepID=A0A0V0QGI0_PSEPJ|nr:hypothetical protein PPERSA_11772 [Pseudocohnilembus persalinus]|eukprot:KRX01325.1 hypothetical protein PPERSA_11772 [Pseudocohnilembus persalinus]